MYKIQRIFLMTLVMGFIGGGDHHQHHDRHPSQSKVRRWTSINKRIELHSQ